MSATRSASQTGLVIEGEGRLHSVGLVSLYGARVVAQVRTGGEGGPLVAHLATTESAERTFVHGVAYNGGVYVRVWGEGAVTDLEFSDDN